jgi:hypothetical protein
MFLLPLSPGERGLPGKGRRESSPEKVLIGIFRSDMDEPIGGIGVVVTKTDLGSPEVEGSTLSKSVPSTLPGTPPFRGPLPTPFPGRVNPKREGPPTPRTPTRLVGLPAIDKAFPPSISLPNPFPTPLPRNPPDSSREENTLPGLLPWLEQVASQNETHATGWRMGGNAGLGSRCSD